jgi:hypothetical protein
MRIVVEVAVAHPALLFTVAVVLAHTLFAALPVVLEEHHIIKSRCLAAPTF